VKLAVVLVLGLIARTAAAHPLDMGYLRVEREPGELAVTLDIDVAVGEGILKIERLDAAIAAARANELATATYRMAAPAIDGTPCTWTAARAKIVGRSVSISEAATCPAGAALRWELPFVKGMASTFQVLGKVRSQTAERVFVLEKDRLTIDFTGAGSYAVGPAQMVWRGIVHTLPLGFPAGLDHLLFALALVLGGGSVRRLLALAGVAIVAHAGGGVAGGIVPDIVSVFAPLLIGVVAACAISPRFETARWIAVALYAAIHGDGAFRGSPVDLGAILAFEAGAALALVACVLAFAPAVPLVRREPRHVKLAAAVIAVLAIYAGVVELL
jgi:hypothetical protein